MEKTEAQRNRTAQLVAAIRAAVGLPAKSVSSSSTKLAANAVDLALPHKVLHKVRNATTTATPATLSTTPELEALAAGDTNATGKVDVTDSPDPTLSPRPPRPQPYAS